MATPVQMVRVLIPDTEPAFDGTTLFTDPEIETYLEIGKGNVLRAAAYAMIAVGNSEALISKVIKTQDLSTDGSKIADAFRNAGKELLARADKEDDATDAGYFDIIDFREGWVERPELTEWNWSYWR